MTENEKAKVSAEDTHLGSMIKLFDEEIGDTYEINILKSTSYNSGKEASLYLIQGTTFNESQLAASRGSRSLHWVFVSQTQGEFLPLFLFLRNNNVSQYRLINPMLKLQIGVILFHYESLFFKKMLYLVASQYIAVP